MGTEISAAAITMIKLSLKNEKIMAFPELPKTFLIPISLVLDLAIKSVSPNNPNAAISNAKRADIDKIVLRFFSDE